MEDEKSADMNGGTGDKQTVEQNETRTSGRRGLVSLRRRNLLLGAGAGLLSSPAILRAQGTWPTRPITMVVGFAPGGVNDLVGRHLAPLMGAFLGRPITIINMLGASAGVAGTHVASQPADGHTILVHLNSGPTSYPALAQADVTWRDFDWIGASFHTPVFPVVLPTSPLRNATDFLRALREKDGKMTIGTAGPGVMEWLSITMLSQAERVRFTNVSFPGTAPAQLGLLRGEVDAVISNAGAGRELLLAGRIRPLFHFGTQPIQYPGLGPIPGLSPEIRSADKLLPIQIWLGPAVRRGTPEPIVERLVQAFEHAMRDPGTAKFLDGHGLLRDPVMNRKEANARFEHETRRDSWMVFDAGASMRSPAVMKVDRL